MDGCTPSTRQMSPAALPGYDQAMSDIGFALFPTAIGRCGIAWSERGGRAVHRPEAGDDETADRLASRCGAEEQQPPAAVQQAMARIGALLAGAGGELADVARD